MSFFRSSFSRVSGIAAIPLFIFAADGRAADPLPTVESACPEGVFALPVSLTATTLPTSSIRKFPGALPQLANPAPAGDLSKYALRLDFCTDFVNAPTLGRIIYLQPGAVAVIAKPTSVEGLPVDLYGGSYEKLTVTAPVARGKTLLIQAWPYPSAPNQALFTAAVATDNAHRKFTGTVVVGTAAIGMNAFSKCTDGEPETFTFTIGTANFEVDACSGMGTSGTREATPIALRVTENNPALAPPQRKTLKYSGAELVPVLRLKLSRHNLCDKIYVKTPLAEYALVAARIGVDSPVPTRCDADPEMHTPKQDPAIARFTVKYLDGKFSAPASADFRHFFFNAPAFSGDLH